MQKFSIRFAILLLAFAVGTATVSIWFYRTTAKQFVETVPPVPPIVPNNFPNEPKTNSSKTLEMVFVLDTTGSMGGLIDAAKQKIWSIVNEVMQQKDRPGVKIGLVAYRDNGDAYVTQVLPLTEDLDKTYSTLMEYRADGGGDTPENVRRALADGVEKAGWSKSDENTAQIIFLVGDAPPHDDYAQEPDVLTTTAKAMRQNMIVNTIQCGADGQTQQVWQEIARRGDGKYFAIAQDGGVQAITTPFDAKLGELGNKLGQTFVAYGGGADAAGKSLRAEKRAAQLNIEAQVSANASTAAQADRALNKAINKKAYADDLLQSIENESVALDAVNAEDLPDELKQLSPEERKKEIEKRLAERKKIRAEILALSKQREAFIESERKKAGKQDGFDAAVAAALREQMTRKKAVK